jgi:hypothetical protein
MFADDFHRIAPGLKQSPGENSRVNRFDLGDGFQIETHDHNAASKAVIVDELCHRTGKIDMSVLGFICFHFHIDRIRPGRVVFKESEDLIESRKKLLGMFGASELWMGPIEPTAYLYLAKFARSHSRDNSSTESRSPQGRIVNDYWNPVARQANIQLDSSRSVIQSPPESDQRIFGSQSRSAAVADDQGRTFRKSFWQAAAAMLSLGWRKERFLAQTFFVVVANSLQFDVKGADVNFQLGLYRKPAAVFRDPN